MKKTKAFVLLIMAIFLVFGCLAAPESEAQTAQKQTVTKMNLTGEIAKAEHGYIIRSKKGNAPGEIYTILNPEPKILDEYVKSEKTVPVEVRIVSGDNVEIETIDGKKYRQGAL